MHRSSADLLGALRDPAQLATHRAARLTDLVGRARAAGVLGRLAARTRSAGLLDRIPPRLALHLAAALTQAEAQQRMTRFEVDRLVRALGPLAEGMILLKGAAYVMAALPAAAGRHSGDVDLLFAKEQLAAVEARLLERGWVHAYTSAYTQDYYRQWMHELPPLRHAARLSVVDLHHTILPATNRLHPDPAALIAGSIPIDGVAPVRVLSAPDMVLHLAAHLAQDGDFNHSLREVLDLDDLLRTFAGRDRFWPALLDGARRHELGRPLHYALAAARTLLGTTVPRDVTDELAQRSLPSPLDRAMRAGIAVSLAESGRARVEPLTALWRQGLYMRSHWLRMPPGMLAAHLGRKAWLRIRDTVRPAAK